MYDSHIWLNKKPATFHTYFSSDQFVTYFISFDIISKISCPTIFISISISFHQPPPLPPALPLETQTFVAPGLRWQHGMVQPPCLSVANLSQSSSPRRSFGSMFRGWCFGADEQLNGGTEMVAFFPKKQRGCKVPLRVVRLSLWSCFRGLNYGKSFTWSLIVVVLGPNIPETSFWFKCTI